MAQPTFVAASTKDAEADASVAVPVLTGAANRIIVAVTGYRGPSSVTLNTPTHGTLTFAAIQAQSGGTISQQKCWWARMAGGETGDVTFTISAGTLGLFPRLFTFDGCITSGSPIDATSGALQENTAEGPTVTWEAMNIASTDSLPCGHYYEADNEHSALAFNSVSGWTFASANLLQTAIGTDAASQLHTAVPSSTSCSATTFTQAAADQYSLQQWALIPPGAGVADIAYLSTARARY